MSQSAAPAGSLYPSNDACGKPGASACPAAASFTPMRSSAAVETQRQAPKMVPEHQKGCWAPDLPPAALSAVRCLRLEEGAGAPGQRVREEGGGSAPNLPL